MFFQRFIGFWALIALVLAGTMPARAADPVLTVYTYSSFASEWGPGAAIKAEFEKTCHCTVTYVTAEDGAALLTRLKLEGSRSQGDVVVGLDNNLMAEAAASGLFAPHGIVNQEPLSLLGTGVHFGFYAGARDVLSEEQKNSSGTNQARQPLAWTDPIFVPFDYGYFAIVYDKQAIKNPPQSLRELVEDANGGQIILEDPRVSTPGLGFLLWMKNIYGDQAADAWRKLKPRIRTVAPGWSEAYGLFLKGEAPMVVSYVTSPAYHEIVEKTDRYGTVEFPEGHYVQIEVAARTRSSAQPELAQKFLKFLLSEPAQAHIPQENWMFPVAPVGATLPKSFLQPKTYLLFPPEIVAKNRVAWIREWQDALGAP